MDENTTLFNSLIAKDAIAQAKSADQTIYSIRIDGRKPDELALILICNVIGQHLSSGRNHIYRGVLSMIGNDMLAVWTKAIAALKDRGYYTAEQADDDMEWIRQQIKSAG